MHCGLKQRLEGRITPKCFEGRVVASKKGIIDEASVDGGFQPLDGRLAFTHQGKSLCEKTWENVSCARHSLNLWGQLYLSFMGPPHGRVCQKELRTVRTLLSR